MIDPKKTETTEPSIPVVIVEDEKRSQTTLQRMLQGNFPEIRFEGMAGTVMEAVKMINAKKPSLIFLDIALPDGDGFNVLEQIEPYDFRVIFVTAYEKYAIRAIEFAALHYLLKPLSPKALVEAVERFKRTGKDHAGKEPEKLKILQHNLKEEDQKIMLPTSAGYELIALNDIVRLEASHNYTYCYLTNQRQTVVSRPLLNFEKILEDLPFARVHNQHIINLKYLKKYMRGSGGTVIMDDRSEINVSKGRKLAFLEKLEHFARKL